MTVKLEKCRECTCHKKMKESFVVCSFHKEFNVLALSLPSHNNKGFENGEMVVTLCPKKGEE